MSETARHIERYAQEKARQRRAKEPGENLGQMNFEGFELSEKQKPKEWVIPRNDGGEE
jgi:hypothetical protein